MIRTGFCVAGRQNKLGFLVNAVCGPSPWNSTVYHTNPGVKLEGLVSHLKGRYQLGLNS